MNYDRKPSELGNVQFRRSLYFIRDLSVGDIITDDAVRSVRPGFGTAPKYLDTIVGKPVRRAVQRGTPVRPEDVGEP